MKALIHPGHTKTGAIVGPYVEHALNVEMVGLIHEECIDSIIVHGPTSAIRRAACHGYGGISVEVHHDTGGGNATRIFYRRGSRAGLLAAENIAMHLKRVIPWQTEVVPSDLKTDSGELAYPGAYYALHWTEPNTAPPGILIECAFLDNPKQMAWMLENRVMFAAAVARGLEAV